MAPAAVRELLQGLEMEAPAWIYASKYFRQHAGAWELCQKCLRHYFACVHLCGERRYTIYDVLVNVSSLALPPSFSQCVRQSVSACVSK